MNMIRYIAKHELLLLPHKSHLTAVMVQGCCYKPTKYLLQMREGCPLVWSNGPSCHHPVPVADRLRDMTAWRNVQRVVTCSIPLTAQHWSHLAVAACLHWKWCLWHAQHACGSGVGGLLKRQMWMPYLSHLTHHSTHTHTINTLQVMLTEYRMHQMYYSHVMFTHNPIYTLTEGTYLPVNNTKQPPLGEKGRWCISSC